MEVTKYKHTFQCTCNNKWHETSKEPCPQPSRTCPKCQGSVNWLVDTEEVRVELTSADVASETAELLEQLPEEVRSAVSYMAYERGHSAGELEVLGILRGIVSDLKEPLSRLVSGSETKGYIRGFNEGVKEGRKQAVKENW